MEYKSIEEQEFVWWLEEAQEHKFINNWIYEPISYTLSERTQVHFMKHLKTKVKETAKIIRPHVYTPDFIISPGINFNLIETRLCQSVGCNYFIDTKGSWMNRGAAQEFSINQKWMLQRHHIYMNKIVPKKFFALTWCPEKARLTPKTKKIRECYADCRRVEDVIYLQL